MGDIKPIETVYNGYRFRSRLEARWAVFFDAMGIEYEYEPEGFELEDGYRYLPDFYFPKEDVWVEIKGKKLSDEEREKIERFCIAKCDFINHGTKFRLLSGEIPKEPIVVGGLVGVPCFAYVSPDEMNHILRQRTGQNVTGTLDCGVLIGSLWVNGEKSWNYESLKSALLKARQARFEHGETPTKPHTLFFQWVGEEWAQKCKQNYKEQRLQELKFCIAYKTRDYAYGGDLNLTNLSVVKEEYGEWCEMHGYDYEDFRPTTISNFFRDKRIEAILNLKKQGAPPEYIIATLHISETMVFKYYDNEDYAHSVMNGNEFTEDWYYAETKRI